MALHPDTVFMVPTNKRVLRGKTPAALAYGPGWGRLMVPLVMLVVLLFNGATSEDTRRILWLMVGRAPATLDWVGADTYRELFSNGRLVYHYNVVGRYTIDGQSYAFNDRTDVDTQRAYVSGVHHEITYATRNPAIATLDFDADIGSQFWLFVVALVALVATCVIVWQVLRFQREQTALFRGATVLQGRVEHATSRVVSGGRSVQVLLDVLYSYTDPATGSVFGGQWSGPLRISVPPPGTHVAVMMIRTPEGEKLTLL